MRIRAVDLARSGAPAHPESSVQIPINPRGSPHLCCEATLRRPMLCSPKRDDAFNHLIPRFKHIEASWFNVSPGLSYGSPAWRSGVRDEPQARGMEAMEASGCVAQGMHTQKGQDQTDKRPCWQDSERPMTSDRRFRAVGPMSRLHAARASRNHPMPKVKHIEASSFNVSPGFFPVAPATACRKCTSSDVKVRRRVVWAPNTPKGRSRPWMTTLMPLTTPWSRSRGPLKAPLGVQVGDDQRRLLQQCQAGLGVRPGLDGSLSHSAGIPALAGPQV
jgi:hypothetical protein